MKVSKRGVYVRTAEHNHKMSEICKKAKGVTNNIKEIGSRLTQYKDRLDRIFQ